MIELCGIELAHPVINASGCFDAISARAVFGNALADRFPFSAYVSKTVTLEPREGNPPPRLWEVAGGMLNSIGLPNPGIERYLEEHLPVYSTLGVPLITNVMGATEAEFARLVERVSERGEVSAIELNVSCPNVATGLDIGADPDGLRSLLRALRPLTAKPLIVKLTPNAADVAACALAAEEGGADAVSLINTLRAMALAPGRPGRPWLGGGTGGMSGAAIRAVALAQVWSVAARVAIPVIGMGGVSCGADAAALLEAGAKLVAVGTETFRDPAAGARIASELATEFAENAA
ncbi:MAG TPA: dihydroorotate dehydrogenase [Solirubrobacteraceae bacterium]|nr:dihydroorotate dehydrogenase [Solirubrobacteraceae bacterium]